MLTNNIHTLKRKTTLLHNVIYTQALPNLIIGLWLCEITDWLSTGSDCSLIIMKTCTIRMCKNAGRTTDLTFEGRGGGWGRLENFEKKICCMQRFNCYTDQFFRPPPPPLNKYQT